ncbi:MAG: VWA domain-containing protein [Thermoanaerobaculia bacterium]
MKSPSAALLGALPGAVSGAVFRAVLVALFVVLVAAPAAPLRAQVQTSETKLKTPVKNFKVETSAQYLGSLGEKTVVRIRLSSAEIATALLGKGIHQYSMTIKGSIRAILNGASEALSYPFSGRVDEGEPLQFSFLRSLAPGAYEVEIDLGDAVRNWASLKFPIEVPEVGQVFRPEMAPNDGSTLPSAEGVVLTAPERSPVSAGSGALAAAAPRVTILPPDREAPVGLIRLSATVRPPVTKVEFYLDDKLVLARTRPPYTVEIDLGKIPRRQTVRAVGFDSLGNLIDEDAWAINEGDAKVAVRILPIPAQHASSGVTVRVAVQSINGGTAKTVDLFVDDKKFQTFTAPPYVAIIPAAQYSRASYLRATAVTPEGQEANDIHFLRGQGTAVENVKVDVVQLHVSALDREGRFVKGLTEPDFAVSEDGRPEKLLSFEIAQNLPLNVGLVIDGSGSMRKAMEFVHDAGSALFKDLIHEKDRGFVIEFNEVPTLVAAPTSDVPELVKAVVNTSATGQTALFDSVVLGLYQFRATTGRKALVVISDGGDNHSWVDYPTMLRYLRSIGVPVYVIAVDISIAEFGVRSKLKEMASDTGGEIFFTTDAKKIPDIVRQIETELRSQYVLSYRTDSQKGDEEFRTVSVACKKPDVHIRTMRGYVP